ncbi:alpha/beta hydrolase [Clostridium botulinum]|uniref:alpha/beta fold hydrolase n=1 Tax=Clostridium botulinum TaxID=1491 RepID=UPI000774294F|nr:alpha/beta hydrolase [Clostridium botulinum]NFH79705.1 alpha/beta hydrolase [Clostridium botulinum]NFH82450.1 alpha/beta hydrolase [Clostridium botulinum]NFI11289.1 alpha/beta hydrolase [Clostridium botulinum]NFI13610.1 alpha/beta hydrolase [Clostridium botulinum]NFO83434.1 alpha/beta hydrolase [Clostridium botulinum]
MNESYSDIITNKTADIYYEVYGNGEPIVFLHGNGENLEYFKNQIEYFSNKYMVIAIDTRGHGKSTKGNIPFDFWLFADDVISVLDSLNIKKVHILGFSDGGNTALHLGLKYHNRIKSLILNGANFNPNGVKFLVQAPVIMEYYISRLFSLFSNKAKNNRDILNLMVSNPKLSEEQLQKIKIPALVVAGDNDMIKENHTKLISRLIQNSEVNIISNSSHFVASENPKEFNNVVEDFLNKHKI